MDMQIDGPDEFGNFSIREGEHRRTLSPGRIVNGAWVDTDLSAEPQAVREAAAGAWTPAIRAAFEAVLRGTTVIAPGELAGSYRIAVQAHIDATAQERQYDSGLSIATYAISAVERWAQEAAAFIAWRDSVWIYALAELDNVRAGERDQPSIDEFIAELPPLVWPT